MYLLHQCRTFQSASVTAKQRVKANIRASSWSFALFLSTSSGADVVGCCSTCAPKSWGHLQGTSVAEDKQLGVHGILKQETPQRSQMRVEKQTRSPVLMRVHMPGPQGTIAADVSHAPLGSPSLFFSLLSNFLPHHWSDRGSPAVCCPEVFCGLWAENIDLTFFLQSPLIVLLWSSFPSAFCCQGCYQIWRSEDHLEDGSHPWASW